MSILYRVDPSDPTEPQMPFLKKKRATKVNVTDVGDESDNDNEVWVDERGDHPLLNDAVLRILFGYVTPNDFMTCRLVCKKWTAVSLPFARTIYRVTVCRDGVSAFVELFGSTNCLGIPFTEFRLRPFNTIKGAGSQFIQICGEVVKKIDLWDSRETHSIPSIAELLRYAPNLESFKIPFRLRKPGHRDSLNAKLFPRSGKPSLKYLKTLDFGTALADKYLKACPTFFEELLSAAGNTSTILTSDRSVRSEGEALGLHLLKTVEKLGRESRIEILSLPYVKKDILDVMQRMHLKGFKLKHLSVEFGSPGRTWCDLVELMKESLVSLHIYNNTSLPNHFPRMPKLKILDLGMCMSRQVNVEVIKIQDFNNNFPSLQYLKLNSENKMLDEFFIESENSCPLMESLNFGNSKMNLKAFIHTLDIFPNLTELELKITVDGAHILKKIWTEMSQLVKLYINGRLPARNGIESLITGISNEGFKRIEETIELSALKNMTMEVRRQTIGELIQEHRKLPSIGNLTNLRHLTLNMTARTGRHKPFLSDLTGYFGIYTLKNLRHLSISDCKFTETCSQILAVDMGLDSWCIKTSPGGTSIPTRWNYDNDWRDWSFPCSKFSFNSTV